LFKHQIKRENHNHHYLFPDLIKSVDVENISVSDCLSLDSMEMGALFMDEDRSVSSNDLSFDLSHHPFECETIYIENIPKEPMIKIEEPSVYSSDVSTQSIYLDLLIMSFLQIMMVIEIWSNQWGE
jgi:hypothetical protein